MRRLARLSAKTAFHCLISLWAIGEIPSRAAETDRIAPARDVDCGENALFLFLNLEGHPTSIDQLKAALPPRHRDGYSMAELAATARTLGLDLDGIQLGQGGRMLDRPAIAFLRDARDGHYVVARPVGTTGSLVQVLDPPYAPWVGDYGQVKGMSRWTGRVLVRSDPWPVRNARRIGWIALALAGLLLGWRISSARSRRTSDDWSGPQDGERPAS